MGEYNDPVDYPLAMSHVVEALAHYLYDRYCDTKHLIHWEDPRHPKDCVGDVTEPWNTAGKRMREYWFEEAERLVEHFVGLYKEEA